MILQNESFIEDPSETTCKRGFPGKDPSKRILPRGSFKDEYQRFKEHVSFKKSHSKEEGSFREDPSEVILQGGSSRKDPSESLF
jgi:hypothetical protein